MMFDDKCQNKFKLHKSKDPFMLVVVLYAIRLRNSNRQSLFGCVNVSFK